MNLRFKRLRQLIGPYPYNPILIFLFFFAFFFSRFITIVIEQPKGLERWIAAGVVLIVSLIPSLLFSITAFLVQKFRTWSDQSLIAYILEITSALALLSFVSPFMTYIFKRSYGFNYTSPLTLTPSLFLGSLVIGIIALALMNRAERTIVNRLITANNLVEKLESDRRELVTADEDLRQQTSQFLHDRVQSDLMVIAMQLKNIQNQPQDQIDTVIAQSVARLESIRSSDLRNLVQILTPNFTSGGFISSLRIMIERYESSMKIEMSVHGDVETADSKVLLGIYRIIEQSLLNSLVHGPAKSIKISINRKGVTEFELVISDDGPGVDVETIKSGIGLAVIDSWLSILKGHREIISSSGRGFELRAYLPK